MRVPATPPSPVQNRLLAALPARVFARLRPLLEPVTLTLKYTLATCGEPADHVYFPHRGVMSLLVPIPGHELVEVALVGNEGVVGIHACLDAAVSPFEVICQVPGDGVRMKLKVFQKEMQRGGPLATVSARFLEELLIQMAVASACNRLHTVRQRCARWLLMTHDRVNGPEFVMTQEFLSKMLAIRRTGVSAVAASFKRNGLIDYNRGKVLILDRARLEAVACECYRTIRRASKRIESFWPPVVRMTTDS